MSNTTSKTKGKSTHTKLSENSTLLVDEKGSGAVFSLSRDVPTTIGSGEICTVRLASLDVGLECAATITRSSSTTITADDDDDSEFTLTLHHTLRLECDDSLSPPPTVKLKDNDVLLFTCMPGTLKYRYIVMRKHSNISSVKTLLSRPAGRTLTITPRNLTPQQKSLLQSIAGSVPRMPPQSQRPSAYKGQMLGLGAAIASSSSSSSSSSFPGLADFSKDPSLYDKGKQGAERSSLLGKSPLDAYFSNGADDPGKPFESCTYIDTMRQIDEVSRKRIREQRAQQRAQPEPLPAQKAAESVPPYFREKLKSPDEIAESLDNLGYFLDRDVRDQLLESLYLILHRPDLASLLSTPRSVSHTVLLHGDSGTENFMETLGRAAARHLGAHVLTIGKEDFRKSKLYIKQLENAILSGQKDDQEEEEERTGDKDDRSRSESGYEILCYSSAQSGSSSTTTSISKGDRVRYDGTTPILYADMSQRNMGPEAEAVGTVVVRVEKLAGVEFDKPFPGGTSLCGQCKQGHGAFVSVKALQRDIPRKRSSLMNWVWEAVAAGGGVGPCVVLVKDAECLSVSPRNRKFRRFVDRISRENLPVAILGTTTINPSRDPPSSSSQSASSVPALAVADSTVAIKLQTSWQRDIRNMQTSFLRGLFPTRIAVKPPIGGTERTEWLEHIRNDVENARFNTNKRRLQKAVSRTQKSILLEDLESIHSLRTTIFTKSEANRIVANAISEHFSRLNSSEPGTNSTTTDRPKADTLADVAISPSSIAEAISMVQATKPNTPRAKLSEVVPANEFEKSLLSDVVTPEEAGVSFADIGALEPVKETLQEAVILPLQRPELFRRGNLARPTSGILLFGPPGTGKTMLARAIATESGANFVSITSASITSMWYGESEKYVRALFALAAKIAPTIIFVDEVDSILGRRGDSHEHESSRRVKNEFMACWDGLRTNHTERVMVLAATNRPMDLDDAVLRRLSRRILVDLPDAANREKILRVILKDEELDSGFDFKELARKTEGYSGSDLKNLCVITAYKPVRELLKKERMAAPGMNDGNEDDGLLFMEAPAKKKFKLRCLELKDFFDSMDEIGKSTSEFGTSLNELRKWNKVYGDNGSKTPSLSLSYFS